jgi:hypothetical protein
MGRFTRRTLVAALAQTGSEGFDLSTLWDEEKRRFAMV